jgi:hypothetical protein
MCEKQERQKMARDMLVFQDLILRGRKDALTEIRKALLNQVNARWSHSKDRENEISASCSGNDVIVFAREKGEGIEAVGLLLWSREDGYEVTNIVPRDIRELDFEGYNAALQDFVASVAEPASRMAGFQIEMTPERQSLSDWAPANVADALDRFSKLANKSTGSSHPSDRKRWFDFLFAAYKAPKRLGTDQLIRWLVEVEGWSEEIAHDLAIQYEFGLNLLKEYETGRS